MEEWFRDWNYTPWHIGSRIRIRHRGIVVNGLELDSVAWWLKDWN
jgi:hypothetical protein